MPPYYSVVYLVPKIRISQRNWHRVVRGCSFCSFAAFWYFRAINLDV